MKLIRVWLFGFLFVSVFAHSDDIGLDANIAKYVSVTFQVQGLNESTNALKEAMTSLSSTMKKINKSPQKLTAEQVREFSVLVEKSDQLVMSLERTLKELEPSIERAKKPTTEMLAALLKTTRLEIVNPTVESVKDAVGFWVYLFVLGGIVIVMIVVFSFYAMIKKMREIVQVAKSITGEYEIVRRQS
ncbi:MAG: hypothetical protein ACJAWS_003305 [Oleiphilaceae bacterium]|jgi:hypothetical protein